MSSQYLVISAVGEDREGIVKDLSHMIADDGGSIMESRMSQLGGEFAIIMLVQGAEVSINRIEGQLPKTAERLGLRLHGKRTMAKSTNATQLPYQIEVVSIDHPGLVHDITDFLSTRGINIQNLETRSYAAPHTGTPMFSLIAHLQVPVSLSIAKLRNEFIDFCESLNLDGSIDALR